MFGSAAWESCPRDPLFGWIEAALQHRVLWLSSHRRFLLRPNTRKDALRKSHFLLLSRRTWWQGSQPVETVRDSWNSSFQWKRLKSLVGCSSARIVPHRTNSSVCAGKKPKRLHWQRVMGEVGLAAEDTRGYEAYMESRVLELASKAGRKELNERWKALRRSW